VPSRFITASSSTISSSPGLSTSSRRMSFFVTSTTPLFWQKISLTTSVPAPHIGHLPLATAKYLYSPRGFLSNNNVPLHHFIALSPPFFATSTPAYLIKPVVVRLIGNQPATTWLFCTFVPESPTAKIAGSLWFQCSSGRPDYVPQAL